MGDEERARVTRIGQSVPELLAELVVTGGRATVLTRGGRDLSGKVVHVDNDVVWLREEGELVLAVRAEEVIGLRVLHSEAFVRPPSPRSEAATLTDEPPAAPKRRRRRLSRPTLAPMDEVLGTGHEPEEQATLDPAAVEAGWREHLGRPLSLLIDVQPGSEAEAADLRSVLGQLVPAIRTVRGALLEHIDRVIVSATEEPGAERVESDLWIGVNLGAGRDGRWASAKGMGAAIEAALQS
jgi:hypothetical protein